MNKTNNVHKDGTPCSHYCTKLSRHNLILRGLENFGNTCYLNASIQLLASTKSFQECLCSCLHEIKFHEEDMSFCSFTVALADIVESITYKPSILNYSVRSFYNAFIERCQGFNDEYQHDALEAIQAILDVLEQDVSKINAYRQQRWQLQTSFQTLTTSQTEENTSEFIPITIPTSGFVSHLMICSRCGSRRQIQNNPFSALSVPVTSTPWWRLDPACRQLYTSIFKQFNISTACENPVHATLLDCLREFTASEEVDGVLCDGCNVLTQILNTSTGENEEVTAEYREKLQHTLHKVRSSHDINEDLKENSIPEKETRGVYKNYELISRPPRDLLIQLQRKTNNFNPFMSKRSDFVDFPQEFDLREFCLFSQSIPSQHASQMHDSSETRRKQHRLKRINSWKQDSDKPLSNKQLFEFDEYLNQINLVDENCVPRSRSGSVDSVFSDCSDVHEVDENSLGLDDLEGSESEEWKDIEEQELQANTPFEDSLSYNPYQRFNSQRGGGKPLIYRLMSVIHHLGTGYGGHYICFRRVRDSNGDKWYMINDSKIHEVPWSEVNTCNIYMANYELE